MLGRLAGTAVAAGCAGFPRYAEGTPLRLLRPGWLVLALLLILYLGLAAWGLSDPGVEYDELLFGNASLGILDHSFIAFTLPLGPKNVPMMLMPYIGALKAYLYFPVLRLFGAGPEALRLPVVLVGAVALLLYVAIARRMVGARGALLFAALLATDPSYLYHTRLDWGPVALMLLFKAAAVYCFVRWWETKQIWLLVASGLSLGLGVWDKVNFVWFLLAAGAAAVIVYRRDLLKRAAPREVALFCASIVVGALPLIMYNIAFPLATIREPFEGSVALGDSLVSRLLMLRDTLAGTAVFDFVNQGDGGNLWSGYIPLTSAGENNGAGQLLAGLLTGYPLGQGSLILPAVIVCLLLLVARPHLLPSTSLRATVAAVLAAALIILQIMITKKADGSYHAMMLYPIPQLLLAAVAVGLIDGKGAGPRGWLAGGAGRAIATLALVAVVCSNLLVDFGYLRYFSVEGGKGIWSSAIYGLADYAEQRPSNRFVLMDWGFNTQLLTLSRGSIKKDEVYHWVADRPFEREQFDIYLNDPNSLFLFHSDKFTKFPGPKQLFAQILAERGLREEQVQEFYQKNGEPVYYLSRAMKSSSPLAVPERP